MEQLSSNIKQYEGCRRPWNNPSHGGRSALPLKTEEGISLPSGPYVPCCVLLLFLPLITVTPVVTQLAIICLQVTFGQKQSDVVTLQTMCTSLYPGFKQSGQIHRLIPFQISLNQFITNVKFATFKIGYKQMFVFPFHLCALMINMKARQWCICEVWEG